MGLGMGAGRAHFRGGHAFMQVAAVAAAPDNALLSFEDPVGLDIAGQIHVPFFVLFLGDADVLEHKGDGLEPLFPRLGGGMPGPSGAGG